MPVNNACIEVPLNRLISVGEKYEKISGRQDLGIILNALRDDAVVRLAELYREEHSQHDTTDAMR